MLWHTKFDNQELCNQVKLLKAYNLVFREHCSEMLAALLNWSIRRKPGKRALAWIFRKRKRQARSHFIGISFQTIKTKILVHISGCNFWPLLSWAVPRVKKQDFLYICLCCCSCPAGSQILVIPSSVVCFFSCDYMTALWKLKVGGECLSLYMTFCICPDFRINLT